MLSLLSLATWLITANPPLEEGRALYHFLIGGALVGGAGAVVLLTAF